MQLLLNASISCALYFLLASSFWLIFKTVRFFHIAHGSLYTIGAYTAIGVADALWVPAGPPQSSAAATLPVLILGLCAMAAAGAACGVGLGIDVLVYEPLRRRRASSLVFLLASFGLLVFLDNLVALLFGSDLQAIHLIPIRRGWDVLGTAVITPVQVILVACALALLALGGLGSRTRFARALEAVSLDPLGASIVGIDPRKTILWVVAAGSALAGLGGMLVALELTVRPTIGFQLLFKAIVASVLGGQRLIGVFIASFLLSLLEHATDKLLSGSWRDGVAFLLLIIFLLVRGEGISRSVEEVRPD